MSQPSVYPDMFGFSLGALCLSICNIYVSLEVKFKAVGEDAVKYAERENIINYCVQSVFYLLSTVIAGLAYYKNDAGQYHEDREEYHPPKLDSLLNACSLMLTGGSTDNYLEASQSDGPSPTNLPIALCVAGWVFGVLFWSLKWVFVPYGEHKRRSVPLNVECESKLLIINIRYINSQTILSFILCSLYPSLWGACHAPSRRERTEPSHCGNIYH